MTDEPNVVAIAGDWHGNATWAVDAVRYAASGGAQQILHVGDFGFWTGPRAREYLTLVTATLTDAGLRLWAVDGNHEDFDCLDSLPVLRSGRRKVTKRIDHLPRGYRWKWHDRTWLALGGAASVDRQHREPHVTGWPQELITDEDVTAAVAGGPADVIISHDCPDRVTIPGLTKTEMYWPAAEIETAESNRRRLGSVVDQVRPGSLFHGHYHQRYDGEVTGQDHTWTCFVRGLDRDGGRLRDNVILVDTESMQVVR